MAFWTDKPSDDEEDYIRLYRRLWKLKIDALPSELLTKFGDDTEAALIALRSYAFSQAGFMIWERDLSALQKRQKQLNWVSIFIVASVALLERFDVLNPMGFSPWLFAVGGLLLAHYNLYQEQLFAHQQVINYAQEDRQNWLACEQIFSRERRRDIGHDVWVLARLLIWSGYDEGATEEFSGLARSKLLLDEGFLNLTMSTADYWQNSFWNSDIVRLKVEVWMADALGDPETSMRSWQAPEHLFVEGLNFLGWDYPTMNRAQLRAVLDQLARQSEE